MSFFEIAHFLKTQTSTNDQLRTTIEKLEQEIIKNSQGQAKQSGLHDEAFHIQMYCRICESFGNEIKENFEQNNAMAKGISELYDNYVKTRSQMRELDLQKIVGLDVMVQEAKWEEEKKEIEETLRKKREIYEKMENRNIVRTFRHAQNENQKSLERVQSAKEHNKIYLMGLMKKLKLKQEERNECILDLVQNAKNIEVLLPVFQQNQMLKKLENEKYELMTKLQHTPTLCAVTISNGTTIHDKQGQEQESSHIHGTIPVFDSRNPMAFLKSLNLDIALNNMMQEFCHDLQQKEADKVLEKKTELRSILRKKTNDTEPPAHIKSATQQHVYFLETGSSTESTLSAPTSSINYVENLNRSPTTSSINAIPIAESADVVETIYLLTPTNEVSKTDVGMSANNRPAVQILDCKIIKSVGTPLPKSIPFTLSPISSDNEVINMVTEEQSSVTATATSSKMFTEPLLATDKLTYEFEISSTENDANNKLKPIEKAKTVVNEKQRSVTATATGSEIFKEPAPVKATHNLAPEFENSSAQSDDNNKYKTIEKPKTKNPLDMEFSFENFLSSTKSPTASDEDFVFETERDNPMINFGSINEQKTMESSDCDATEFNFNNSDTGNKKDRKHSFEL